jgi:hypothetical protein
VGITVDWYNADKTVLLQIYENTWKWEEYISSFEKIARLAGEASYPIGIIADVGGIRHIPARAVTHGSWALRSLPSNVALSVVVTPSASTLALLKMIQTITQYDKIRLAATREEARVLLQAVLHEDAPR